MRRVVAAFAVGRRAGTSTYAAAAAVTVCRVRHEGLDGIGGGERPRQCGARASFCPPSAACVSSSRALVLSRFATVPVTCVFSRSTKNKNRWSFSCHTRRRHCYRS